EPERDAQQLLVQPTVVPHVAVALSEHPPVVGRENGDPPQADALRAAYEAAAARLGRSLDRMLASAEDDRSRVTVLTADHGWMLGERHGYVGHDGWLYEELLRVPLWLHDSQGRIAPGRTSSAVSLHDVPSSLARLVGVPWTPRDGAEDLIRARTEAPKRFAVFETFAPGAEFGQQALLADGYKLHRPVLDAPGWPIGGRPAYPRLHRIEGLREGRDLAPGAPRVVDTLERLYVVWQGRYGRLRASRSEGQ
ncbi:MAG: hypothetical protein AAFZ65_18275, partial [Planctomycetota bacterium]